MPHENVEFIELVNRLHLCIEDAMSMILHLHQICLLGEFVVQVFGVDVLEPHLPIQTQLFMYMKTKLFFPKQWGLCRLVNKAKIILKSTQ
jgi:hypothetical protein